MKFLFVLSSVFVAASAQIGGGLVGGWNAQDPSDMEYVELLSNYTGMGLLKETNGYTILSVDTQVVSGLNYKYKLSNGKGHECTLVLYVQSWTDTYEVTQDDCHLTAHQAKRAGGYSEVTDMSDEGLQACTSEALDQINMQSNSMYRLVESKVSAQSHVVQGVEYKISMSAVESTCMNSGTSQGLTASDCAVSDSAMDGSRWSFNCWYRAWMDGADKLQVSGLTME